MCFYSKYLTKCYEKAASLVGTYRRQCRESQDESGFSEVSSDEYSY
jgi:hypothetical protein